VRLVLGLAGTTAVVAACSSPPIEEGLFFPTWGASDGPTAIVQGSLIEANRCLFLKANGGRTLILWEEGLGFEDDALLNAGGDPIASVGETIHGGGGYFGDLRHFEDLAGEPVPERCVPAGDGDRFALIYDVETGPFE
jgi:hypothetical protein